MKEKLTLFFDLQLAYYKSRRLHWFYTGTSFKSIHEIMASYYKDIEEFIDELAETLIVNDDLKEEDLNDPSYTELNTTVNVSSILDGMDFIIEDCMNINDYKYQDLLSRITGSLNKHKYLLSRQSISDNVPVYKRTVSAKEYKSFSNAYINSLTKTIRTLKAL